MCQALCWGTEMNMILPLSSISHSFLGKSSRWSQWQTVQTMLYCSIGTYPIVRIKRPKWQLKAVNLFLSRNVRNCKPDVKAYFEHIIWLHLMCNTSFDPYYTADRKRSLTWGLENKSCPLPLVCDEMALHTAILLTLECMTWRSVEDRTGPGLCCHGDSTLGMSARLERENLLNTHRCLRGW